jgi:hypothetical protein
VGKEKPHPCLTTDWVLGQFGTKRNEAEKRYREFVEAGIGEKTMWKKVKGQSILGGEDFVEDLIGYVKGQRDIREIPKEQRYRDRPSLEEVFPESAMKELQRRNRKIREAVEAHGYSHREVAAHLGIHYTTVSRIINEKWDSKQ